MNMEDKPINVLASVYACGPNWGSEVGMGWNWVINLSNYCKLTVITEKKFQDEIEKKLQQIKLKYKSKFYYIDIGEMGRKLFWKQGSFLFYRYYKKWQKKAYLLALELINNEKFDLIHQLNMIGFREPGYLWKIDTIPYIIGPVGGYEQFPKAYFSILNFRDKLFYLTRLIINFLQRKYLRRPKKAYTNAKITISATTTAKEVISKYSKIGSVLITETGAMQLTSERKKEKLSDGGLNFCWVGIIQGRKALPIALQAIAKSGYKEKIHFHIIGDGPNLESSKKLAKQLELKNITWYGRISNEKSKQIIANCDILFFTSVLDATSTVIFEALESGTPVLCHDAYSFGTVIDDSCGMKIPMISPSKSVELFASKINFIVEKSELLKLLQIGCFKRIKEYYWDSKAKQMFEIYKDCL